MPAKPQRRDSDADEILSATLSPDGMRIAFLRRKPTRWQARICVAAIDFKDAREVTTIELAHVAVAHPAYPLYGWMPDGKGLLLQRGASLVEIDAESGAEKRKLCELDANDDVRALAWAPGGASFALETTRGLAAIALADSKRVELAIGAIARFGWTSDAKRIVAAIDHGTTTTLVAIDVASGATTTIADAIHGDFDLAWAKRE